MSAELIESGAFAYMRALRDARQETVKPRGTADIVRIERQQKGALVVRTVQRETAEDHRREVFHLNFQNAAERFLWWRAKVVEARQLLQVGGWDDPMLLERYESLQNAAGAAAWEMGRLIVEYRAALGDDSFSS